MSSRHNFLDADNSIMERNLRFVTNDLEDNLNQYFGGSGSRGHNPAISAPPRDYKVVQPKPDDLLEIDKRYGSNDHRKRARSPYFENYQFYSDSPRRESGRNLNDFRSALIDKDYLRSSSPSNNEWNVNNFRSSSSSQSPSRHYQYLEERDITIGESKVQRRRSRSPTRNKYNFRSYELFRSRSPFKDYTQEERGLERNVDSPPSRYFNSMAARQDYEQRMISNSRFRNNDGDEHNLRSFRSRSPPRNVNFMPNESGFGRRDNESNGILNYVHERDQIVLSRSPPINFHSDEPNYESYQSFNSCFDPRDLNFVQDRNEFGRNLYDLTSRRANYRNERKNRDDQVYRSEPSFGSFQACSPPRAAENFFTSFGLLTYCSPSIHFSNMDDSESSHNDNQFIKPSSKIVGFERSKTLASNFGGFDKDSGDLNLSPSTSKRSPFIRQQHSNQIECISPNLLTAMRENAASNNNRTDENVKDVLDSSLIENISIMETNTLCGSRIKPSSVQCLNIFSEQNQLIIPQTSVNLKTATSIIESDNLKCYSPSLMEIDTENQNIPSIIKNHNVSNNNLKYIWKNTTAPSLIEISNTQNQNILPITNNNTSSSSNTKYILKNSTSPTFYRNDTPKQVKPLHKKQPKLSKTLKVSKSNLPQEPSVIEIVSRFKLTAQKLQNLTAQELKTLEDYVSLQDPMKVKEIMLRESKRERNICIDVIRRKLADYTVIKSGLKEPSAGHLKANPKEYWTKWWSLYKYIENAVKKVDHESVYKSLHITKDLKDAEFQAYKKKILNSSVSKINRYINVTEHRYPYIDSFRFFHAKKLLEDPKFQQDLHPRELQRVEKALARLQDKPKLAYVHQSLICRWHASMDIVKRANNGELVKFRSSRSLLKNKLFNYLVYESIKILKTMCQEDWQGFEEFYKNLKVEEFDSSSIALLQQKNPHGDFQENCSSDEDDDDIDEKVVKIKDFFLR